MRNKSTISLFYFDQFIDKVVILECSFSETVGLSEPKNIFCLSTI